MKEWLVKMAKELGLPDGATEEQVLAKLSERFSALSGSDKRYAGIAAQLAAHGLKVEGEKVVKADSTPRNPDDVAKLAAYEVSDVKSKIAAGKATVDALCAAGKIPPAMKATLDKIFATSGKMESLQLGKGENDSEVVIKGSIEILEDLKKLFDALPKITGNAMSTVGGQAQGDSNGKKAGELGRAVAARAANVKKKEPAAK